MKRSEDAARHRVASNSDDLIGKFNATQRRERVLISNSFSHHVVVFRSTIMLLETGRVKDQLAAWAKAGGVLFSLGGGQLTNALGGSAATQAVNWIQSADSGLARLADRIPNSGAIEAKVAALEHLRPDLLDECFAGYVSEVPTACITSAVLNRGPLTVAPAAAGLALAAVQVPLSFLPVVPALINVGPLKAELIIKYRNPERKSELELWLGTDEAEPLDDIAKMMSEALGDRFSERAEIFSAIRAALPLRSMRWDWSR